MVHNTLAQVFPDDGIIVLESPSSTLALRNQLRISKPGSYYFGAGGGLGFGLAAAIGVQLAQPDRPVVCVLGEGSAQYAITGFWTAAAYDVPVTFLVLRNEEYSILKWFADIEEVKGAPGLDLPALEVAKVAESYGVASKAVSGRDELHAALEGAIGSSKPRAGRGPGHAGHGAVLAYVGGEREDRAGRHGSRLATGLGASGRAGRPRDRDAWNDRWPRARAGSLTVFPRYSTRLKSSDLEAWEERRLEPREILHIDDLVVVLMHEYRRGKGSGVELETDTAVVFTVRDGRVAHIQGYMDQAAALEAAGLPPPD